MFFRDKLVCGHSMLVEVLVDLPPAWRCRRDVGSFSFCAYCPQRETGGLAIREIVSTTHVLAAGVEADADGVLYLDLPAMCEAAGFEASEANQATLASAAQALYGSQGIPIEIDGPSG